MKYRHKRYWRLIRPTLILWILLAGIMVFVSPSLAISHRVERNHRSAFDAPQARRFPPAIPSDENEDSLQSYLPRMLNRGGETRARVERMKLAVIVLGSDGRADSGAIVFDADALDGSTAAAYGLALRETYTSTVEEEAEVKGSVQPPPAESTSSGIGPTAVRLLTFGEKESVAESWWWVSWPWLMGVLTAISLVGVVWIKRRRLQKKASL